MPTDLSQIPAFEYGETDLATIFYKVAAQELFTPRSSGGNIVNLNLNSSGNIEFNVSGSTGTSDQLTLTADSDVLKFKTPSDSTKKLKMESGILSSNEFFFNDFSTYSDSTTAYIDVSNRKLSLVSSELELDASVQIGGDIKVNGNTFTENLHMTKNVNNSNITFAFIINDEGTLDLIKNNSNNNSTNRVATFGKGMICDNNTYSLSNYNGTGGGNIEQGQDTTGLRKGTITGTNVNSLYWGWNPSQNAWIDSEKLGLGTNNPQEKLHVAGKIQISDPINMQFQTSNVMKISSSNLSLSNVDNELEMTQNVIRLNNFRFLESNDSLHIQRYITASNIWETLLDITH